MEDSSWVIFIFEVAYSILLSSMSHLEFMLNPNNVCVPLSVRE